MVLITRIWISVCIKKLLDRYSGSDTIIILIFLGNQLAIKFLQMAKLISEYCLFLLEITDYSKILFIWVPRDRDTPGNCVGQVYYSRERENSITCQTIL